MNTIRISVLQHEPFEGPGLIADWAVENNHSVAVYELYKGDNLPGADTFDWLVIMGGGMSVNDEAVYPWLKPEKELVRNAISDMKAVIGICLGSQMIASALGQNVYKNNDKEIGWYPVMLTDEGENSGLLTKAWNNNVFFHWHGETFDLPDGAVHMAFSKACRNQAFHIHGRVFGFQFHPETNTQTLNQMISAGGDELVKGKYVMNAGEILDQQHYLLHCKELMFYFLSRLANSSNLLG